ncbi:hypothetical protein ABL78_1305 [Leptomonas seymouri]|uniref:Transmembrane protein n=1 Tax=Leptomonas seymouri TaxID=5684 RepID=A0A0N0P8H6_LEPSE|nr:hypothetical protein ABL78_1305 [Leptomonas seymouri]|eukprot:KPI89537.1 hypothetical protein ABL78_1305 [Leptomonas seymouri]
MPPYLSARARGPSIAPTNSSASHLLLLLSLAALCCVVLVSTTVHAATVTSPAVVDHFGDTIPLTMYMRLKRQTQKSFLLPVAHAAMKLQLEKGEVEEDEEGNVMARDADDGDGTARAGRLPDNWNLRDLELPSFGATTGKHRNQIIRNLPPTYAPRFGISRVVMLMMNATLRAAGATLEGDASLQQSDSAVRFSVGRGLQKESTWLPVASRHKVARMLTELLGNRLEALRETDRDALDAAAHAEQQEEAAGTANHGDDSAVHYLSQVTFYFGYQTNEQHKLTSFAIDASYSTVQKPGIELRYIWSEHRPYTPNRALVVCSAVSLLVTMVMTMAVFHPSSRSMLLFSQRIVAVRAHE